MPRRRARQNFVTLAIGGGLLLWSNQSLAFEAEIESDTTAQGYQLRNAWGDPVLSRRRYLQTLGMRVTGIGRDPTDEAPYKGPDVSFHMRMRLDVDFGVQPQELSYRNSSSMFVPGLERGPFDLMYAYVQVRNIADGLLSGRLGRSYVVDPLGWWSFDGALVRMELPVFVAIEAYGGLEQRAGLPLSTGRFERGGVWRGDRTLLDANTYPEFLAAAIAPAHGFVVESIGLPIVHGRVAYRRVWNTGTVRTNLLPADRLDLPVTTDGTRISQERVGASADVLVDDVGVLRGGAIYDLHRAQLTSWYATLDGFVASRVTAGVDVDRATTMLGRVDVGGTDRRRGAV